MKNLLAAMKSTSSAAAHKRAQAASAPRPVFPPAGFPLFAFPASVGSRLPAPPRASVLPFQNRPGKTGFFTPGGTARAGPTAFPTPVGTARPGKSAFPTPGGTARTCKTAFPTPAGTNRPSQTAFPTPGGTARPGKSAFFTPCFPRIPRQNGPF